MSALPCLTLSCPGAGAGWPGQGLKLRPEALLIGGCRSHPQPPSPGGLLAPPCGFSWRRGLSSLDSLRPDQATLPFLCPVCVFLPRFCD